MAGPEAGKERQGKARKVLGPADPSRRGSGSFPAAVEKCQAADEAFGEYLSLAKLVLQPVGR
jgi:hypothetical protein